MSLAQHVSAIEGVDRVEPADEEPADSTYDGFGGSIRRRISYDFFPQPVEVIEDTSTTAPYKVSTAKRLGRYLTRHKIWIRDAC